MAPAELKPSPEAASLAAIETDPLDSSREYIPLPGGWEVQTKGAGSTYRLLDKKTGERHAILSADWTRTQEFFTRFAKEVHAASSSPTAPVQPAMEIAAQHAIALEQCSIFAESPYLAKAMREAALFLRSLAPAAGE